MNVKSASKIFKENQYILYSQIIDKFYYFVFFAILARSLDLKSYGSIIIVFTFANLMVMLFSFGFPIYLQREVAFKNTDAGKLFTTLFSSSIFLTIPVLVISSIMFAFIYPDLNFNLYLLLIIIIVISSNEYLIMSLLKGLKKYKSIFVITSLSRIITLGFIVIIWLSGFNSDTIIYVFLLGNGLLLFTVFFVSHKYYQFANIFNIRFKNLVSLFVTVFPIWFAMLFNFLYDKVDIFIISKMVNYEQLSFYSIAYGVLKSSTIAFSFLLVGGLSSAASFTDNKKGLKIFLFKYSELLIIISLIISLIMFFGAKYILIFLFTEKFVNSTYILQVLSFAIIPLSLNNLTGVAMNGIGLYKENMYVTIIGFLFNLFANIMIIPKYGIAGAAYITILTEIIILTGDVYFLKQKHKI